MYEMEKRGNCPCGRKAKWCLVTTLYVTPHPHPPAHTGLLQVSQHMLRKQKHSQSRYSTAPNDRWIPQTLAGRDFREADIHGPRR